MIVIDHFFVGFHAYAGRFERGEGALSRQMENKKTWEKQQLSCWIEKISRAELRGRSVDLTMKANESKN